MVEGSRTGRGTRFLLKNRFKAGETIELLTPSGVHAFEAMPFLREKTGEIVDTLGIGGEIIRMDVPFATEKGDFLRGETRNHRKYAQASNKTNSGTEAELGKTVKLGNNSRSFPQ